MTRRTDSRTTARSEGLESGSDTPDEVPLVTVVITTYNRPSYLRRAVRSVLDQTYENIELVVVDGHSETPAREALSEVDCSGLTAFQCIRHEENKSANAGRNTGIQAASGDFIALLDDDDQWHPEKLERQVEKFLEADEDVGVVYTGTKTPPSKLGDDMTKSLLCRNVIGGMSKVMVRADLAKEQLLDEQFPAWGDLEWYIRLSRRTEFEQLPESLVIYEWDSDNRLSENFEKECESYQLFIERFDALAAEYGRLFRRKMHSWAAYRVGSAALLTDNYEHARRFFVTAVTFYPFEPKFWTYAVAAAGGRFTHHAARKLKRVASD